MGYPMTYKRVVSRNHLHGDYVNRDARPLGDGRERLPDGRLCAAPAVAGDLRRLEQDQRDERHLARYAELAGVTPEQARAVLDAFFDGFPEHGPAW